MNNWRSAHTLAERFVGRWDLYAKQTYSGYVSIKEPLQGRHIIDHLEGKMTLGAYVLDEHSRAKFTVVDADDDESWEQINNLAVRLEGEGIPSYKENSRRGGHLWFFYEEPIPGEIARSFGNKILKSAGFEGIEVFPKQDRLTSGPGSLIRMPFGVHQRAGERFLFEDIPGSLHEQIEALKNPDFVDPDLIWHYALKPEKQQKRVVRKGEVVPVWERIKESMPAAAFIREFVELTPSASGYVGKCPFHQDEHKSFGVHEETNTWRCFAGCGSGSIIDFYMLYKNVEFTDAIDELGELFGVKNG